MEPLESGSEQGLRMAERWAEEHLAPEDRPKAKVSDTKGVYFPLWYEVQVEGRTLARLLVNGDEVLQENGPLSERSDAALGRYLRRIRLLERRDWDFRKILGLFECYGRSPAPGFSVGASSPGPSPSETPRLVWGAHSLTLVVYNRYEPPSGPVGFGSGMRPTESFLRATLVLDESYTIHWTVERSDGWMRKQEPIPTMPPASQTPRATGPAPPIIQIGPVSSPPTGPRPVGPPPTLPAAPPPGGPPSPFGPFGPSGLFGPSRPVGPPGPPTLPVAPAATQSPSWYPFISP